VNALAVAPAAPPAGHKQQLAELVDLPALVARGLDLQRLRFVPAPSDPLFGYARCPVRGCLNVTEHTATSLCSRCQHRYGRWQRTTDGGAPERFLVEVTQTRSEDVERLCLVCRTPGHERPVAAQGLCYSCLSRAKGRGQGVAAYVAGDERWPPASPRSTFGLCRMACDALACGGDGLCGGHLRHWRRASRPAGAAFEAWRALVGEQLPASRYVDVSALSETVRWEFLLGLSVAIDGHRRTRISELRRVVSLLGQTNVASIAELDVTGVRTPGVRLFVAWLQDRLRLAFADPDSEWRKDVWDMRVFGKPQAYRVDFTQISQPWLRELAKQWAREQAPLVHAASTRRAVASIGELSRSLRRRDDRGKHPTLLGRQDISLFLARVTRAHSAGRVSAHKRSVLIADVSYFLRQARDLELGAESRPVFGLPASFTLSREEVRRVARAPAPPPARALPDTVVAQLLAPDALALLEQMHGERVRIAVELLADTGRRPNEICILSWDCLDFDAQVSTRAARRASWRCSSTTCPRSRAPVVGCRSTSRPPS
jgi:integrase